MKKILVTLGVVLAILVVTNIPCLAQELINGCYKKNNGQLRIVSDLSECNNSELPISWLSAESGPSLINVNCPQGQTITEALEQLVGANNYPVTIQVKGTCNENITIVRDDVTLIGDPSGGAINGPDLNKHTIDIRAGRTVIDSLTVTGGRAGINLYGSGGSTIQNCTVQNAGSIGILFKGGSYGTVDRCTVQNNGSHGIYIESATVNVTNSMISLNRMGIDVHLGGKAWIGVTIGITTGPQYAGNTIINNGGNGIFVYGGSSAYIGGNTINGNGTALNMFYGVSGIQVINSTAILIGSNTITNNTGVGVLATNSGVRIGEAAFGLPTHNTITGNGADPSIPILKGGVQGDLGSSLNIIDADISNNIGGGVILGRCSNVLFPALFGPPTTVTGNSAYGLQCIDANFCSRYGGNTSGITGNTVGDVSPSCTLY
jgi:parallel beta-helix repeat protein